MSDVKRSQRFRCPACKVPMRCTAIWRAKRTGVVVRRRRCDVCGLKVTTHEQVFTPPDRPQ